MGFIEDELSEVRKLCEHLVRGSRLVSCVRTMVRVEIKRTETKSLVVCVQFPKNYPDVPLLLEIKSKTLSDKLLQKLTDICENEIKKYLGKPQVLKLLLFIRSFIDENPLICCHNEIINLKKLLSSDDELKLKQKTSHITLKAQQGLYIIKCKLIISDDYPNRSVSLQDLETNFTPLLERFICAQAKEIGRQCVEPPLRKPKRNEPPFKPSPSLEKVGSFLIDCIKRLPTEKCQICSGSCLPDDPINLEKDETSPKHIERVYCGHLFHLECLLSYMKKPPFQNKKCPKVECGKPIYHQKWGISEKLAEDRWAHEQARERELAEVTDFFK